MARKTRPALLLYHKKLYQLITRRGGLAIVEVGRIRALRRCRGKFPQCEGTCREGEEGRDVAEFKSIKGLKGVGLKSQGCACVAKELAPPTGPVPPDRYPRPRPVR